MLISTCLLPGRAAIRRSCGYSPKTSTPSLSCCVASTARLIDENEARGIEMRHGLAPSPAPPHHVGPVLLSRQQCFFFEAQSLPSQKAPDRVVRDDDAALSQQVLEAMQRQVRHFLDLATDEIAVPLEPAPQMAAELRRRHASGLTQPLRPLDDRRRRKAEPRGDGAAALA